MSQQRSAGDALDSPLGKSNQYPEQYDPSLLYGVPRKLARIPLGIEGRLPFYGVDIWNLYEVSWLDPSGRPVIALVELKVPVESPCIIESKSLKLYCNSLNMTSFDDRSRIQSLMTRDLSRCAGAPVEVKLFLCEEEALQLADPEGICIDQAPFHRVMTAPCPDLLCCLQGRQSEILFSRLFRSRCPVTGQPDWATIIVEYSGAAIDHGSLLEYLVSYRRHQSFHEACVEQMFMDIYHQCRPDSLQVTARFTRRGGIDINPIRATRPREWTNCRTPFQ